MTNLGRARAARARRTATARAAASGDALGCPVCNTETGAAVRAGIFDRDFATTLASALAPFPVLLGVVAALHRGWTPRRLLLRLTPPGEGSPS